MTEVQTPGLIILLLNFYGYFIPFILLAIWAPLALVDLTQREDMTAKTGAIWTTAIIALPLIGAGAYHIIGNSTLPVWVRNYLVYGGSVILVLFIIIGSLIG